MKFNKKTAAIIALFALLTQLIIITYNHMTGFLIISGPVEFLIRVSFGTSFSTLFGIITIYLDLKIISLLDLKYTWKDKPAGRFLYESAAIILIGIFIGVTITSTVHILFPYDDLRFNIINNSLITVVLNLIIILALEALNYFKYHQEALIRAEKLERENTQIRFEVLKNQLNPHFLFNSLNVLSSLIRKDPVKSQDFIDEFSSIYRYILDVIDQPVVELKDELSFAKSYLFLQQIRFENAVKYNIDIDAAKLNYYIPPLAVQTLLENALKHNKAVPENPLCISISNDGDVLVIKNNVQPRYRSYESKGIGLSNLKKRYSITSGLEPEFHLAGNEYTARLPLIKADLK